jgi:hypothetical protein
MLSLNNMRSFGVNPIIKPCELGSKQTTSYHLERGVIGRERYLFFFLYSSERYLPTSRICPCLKPNKLGNILMQILSFLLFFNNLTKSTYNIIVPFYKYNRYLRLTCIVPAIDW